MLAGHNSGSAVSTITPSHMVAQFPSRQASIGSNASARGALAGLQWGSDTEIRPLPAAAESAVPEERPAAAALAAAASADTPTEAAAGAVAAIEAEDWGMHPRSHLGSVASLGGVDKVSDSLVVFWCIGLVHGGGGNGAKEKDALGHTPARVSAA